MQTGQLNSNWGKTIVDQLVKLGVDYFCLSPGFRSTPLAIAIAENSEVTPFIHFDERGSAFHALGYAKASGKPAAVIVTSGTALGNLMPAVMEAWAAHIPLILLTCDRPAELRDTMANQTCDQIKIFGDYLNYFFDLPSPNTSLPENFLSTTIAQAVSQALYPIKGPVQLNCPFPEPFFDEQPSTATPLPPTSYTLPEYALSKRDCDAWAERLSQIENGVIVLGTGGGCPSAELLSEKLGWPILADINSSYRNLACPRSIAYYHHILKTLPDLKADAILHFGDRFVSKFLLQWIGSHKKVIQVAKHSKRCDPLHRVSDRIVADPELFCCEIVERLEKRETSWFSHWQELSKLAAPDIEDELLTEPGVIGVLEKQNSALFIANSMPIRDADMFFFPKSPRRPIFANRGLSGIDGNIATCAGIAHHMPLTALVGDQTLLHDLNSLAQLKKTKHPVKLIVINNGGGGIFSFVAIGERKDLLDTYFAGAHQMRFEKAAELFDFPYHNPKTTAELNNLLEKEGSCMIEVHTNREANLLLHKKIDQQVKISLCSSFSTAS